MLAELAQSGLLYLCLSAPGFTRVSFPHPHSNKRVVFNFPFVPDSEKTGHHFILSYWKEKGEHSGRKTGILLRHLQYNCIYFIFVILVSHFLQPKPCNESSLLSRLLYRAYEYYFGSTVLDQLSICKHFALTNPCLNPIKYSL